MPYGIKKQGNKWVTYNTDTGDVKGTHATRAKAERQQELLEMVRHGGTPRNK